MPDPARRKDSTATRVANSSQALNQTPKGIVR
jgi:hypothetical protein